MKAIWNGTISFGLVSIPIKLYAAIEHHQIGFKMLCKKCQTPVHYKKFCEGCNKELGMSDIVKALEVTKGEYITFTQDELDKLRPEKTDMISIKEFIDSKEIDPIYYNKFYYCAPQKAKERAYYLIKEVLEASNKVAIGRFVMREKEYVCAISSYQKGLLLSTLSYKYEVRDINDIKELKEKPEMNKEEINLAIKLVNQLYAEEFDISDFKDTFAEQLKAMLEKPELKSAAKGKKPKRIQEKPLLEALKASLQ
jgi:DNA end-binding protein Ku